jgi:CheY-like chemotaxis protein
MSLAVSSRATPNGQPTLLGESSRLSAQGFAVFTGRALRGTVDLATISTSWPKDKRMSIKILIADDDATIRLLLRRLLEKQPDWEVCGDAINGLEAIERVEQLAPDVVVMDLGMPVMTGLQAAPEIAKAHPQLPMLLISVQEVSSQLASEARKAGYRGAVTKSSGNEVLRGIHALLRHENFFYADDGSTTNGTGI